MPNTLRSCQQAALGADLPGFIDAPDTGQALFWPVAIGWARRLHRRAWWPRPARGPLSVNGWNIQDITAFNCPVTPEQELRYWYQ